MILSVFIMGGQSKKPQQIGKPLLPFFKTDTTTRA
jgi:hypothetical protein